NVQGEFGYYLILSQYLDKKRAQEAAAGWGGDQYIFYDKADSDDSIIAQFSTWDTEKDSIEFFKAYNDRTAKRYTQAKLVKNEENLKLYDTENGQVLIERHGSKVLIIEGAAQSQMTGIEENIWKQAQVLPFTPAPIQKLENPTTATK